MKRVILHDYAVYQTFIGAMNEKVREQIGISNPFIFRHISSLKVQCVYFFIFYVYVLCVKICLVNETVTFVFSECLPHSQNQNHLTSLRLLVFMCMYVIWAFLLA